MRSYAVLRTASPYIPPVALMLVIFALSAQPDLSTGLGGWDTLLRKLAHMAEFGLLWWLWLRALGGTPRAAAAACAIALAYAATDELHQAFVDGRDGSPVDWAIDAAGVGIAVALWARRTRRYSQPRSVA